MNCNCNNNYYVDENGERHTDIPMGTSPQAAYARTNLLLNNKVEQLENEMADIQETLSETEENVSTQLETTISTISESLEEASDSIQASMTSALTEINARVDNIIAHNNDTEGNSELVDIRTGIDSMVYASAGSAVRTQISKVSSALDSITVSDTLFTEVEFDTTVNDKYMGAGGTEGGYSGGIYGTISIHSGEKFKIKAEVGVNIRAYVLKDANGIVKRYAEAENFHTRHNYDTEITIASEEDGGTLYVSSISADYFGLKKEQTNYVINRQKIPDFPVNPLNGKTAVFDGDSICAGLSVGSSNPTYGYGWAGRIGTKNNMTWKNYGVSGGTVTSDTYNWTSVAATNVDYSSGNTYYKRDYSATGTNTMYIEVPESEWDGTSGLYVRGNARHWESTNVDTMYNEYPNADYVILESCLNDGFNMIPKGTVSTDDFSPQSTTTLAGAMEYMIDRALTLFPNAKIGVIIPHRPNANNLNNYHEITRSVCKKWGIPYIDLHYGSGLCVKNPTQKAVMFADNTHLTAAGYDMITDKIEAWMKTL